MAEAPKAPARERISLAALQAPFAEALARVDERLLASLRPAASFFEPVRGQLTGGKRLRPLLLLICAQREAEALPPLALILGSAVELVHLASLMHDDVLDGAPERRGLPSAPAALGSRRAVLAGDYLAAAAYQEVAAADLPEAGAALSNAVLRMTAAEVTGALRVGELLSEAEYLDLIAGKTAALFATAARLGAMAAEHDEAVLAGVTAYGESLGMAFQIQDDLLDLYGDADRLGKGTHWDLAAGLYTLPVIYAAQAPGGEQIRQRLAELRATPEDKALVAEIADLTRLLGGEARATAKMHEYLEVAATALPPGFSPPALLDLAEYVSSRAS
jgi:geranylgeranyl pyrophosphate synthase